MAIPTAAQLRAHGDAQFYPWICEKIIRNAQAGRWHTGVLMDIPVDDARLQDATRRLQLDGFAVEVTLPGPIDSLLSIDVINATEGNALVMRRIAEGATAADKFRTRVAVRLNECFVGHGVLCTNIKIGMYSAYDPQMIQCVLDELNALGYQTQSVYDGRFDFERMYHISWPPTTETIPATATQTGIPSAATLRAHGDEYSMRLILKRVKDTAELGAWIICVPQHGCDRARQHALQAQLERDGFTITIVNSHFKVTWDQATQGVALAALQVTRHTTLADRCRALVIQHMEGCLEDNQGIAKTMTALRTPILPEVVAELREQGGYRVEVMDDDTILYW